MSGGDPPPPHSRTYPPWQGRPYRRRGAPVGTRNGWVSRRPRTPPLSTSMRPRYLRGGPHKHHRHQPQPHLPLPHSYPPATTYHNHGPPPLSRNLQNRLRTSPRSPSSSRRPDGPPLRPESHRYRGEPGPSHRVEHLDRQTYRSTEHFEQGVYHNADFEHGAIRAPPLKPRGDAALNRVLSDHHVPYRGEPGPLIRTESGSHGDESDARRNASGSPSCRADPPPMYSSWYQRASKIQKPAKPKKRRHVFPPPAPPRIGAPLPLKPESPILSRVGFGSTGDRAIGPPHPDQISPHFSGKQLTRNSVSPTVRLQSDPPGRFLGGTLHVQPGRKEILRSAENSSAIGRGTAAVARGTAASGNAISREGSDDKMGGEDVHIASKVTQPHTGGRIDRGNAKRLHSGLASTTRVVSDVNTARVMTKERRDEEDCLVGIARSHGVGYVLPSKRSAAEMSGGASLGIPDVLPSPAKKASTADGLKGTPTGVGSISNSEDWKATKRQQQTCARKQGLEGAIVDRPVSLASKSVREMKSDELAGKPGVEHGTENQLDENCTEDHCVEPEHVGNSGGEVKKRPRRNLNAISSTAKAEEWQPTAEMWPESLQDRREEKRSMHEKSHALVGESASTASHTLKAGGAGGSDLWTESSNDHGTSVPHRPQRPTLRSSPHPVSVRMGQAYGRSVEKPRNVDPSLGGIGSSKVKETVVHTEGSQKPFLQVCGLVKSTLRLDDEQPDRSGSSPSLGKSAVNSITASGVSKGGEYKPLSSSNARANAERSATWTRTDVSPHQTLGMSEVDKYDELLPAGASKSRYTKGEGKILRSSVSKRDEMTSSEKQRVHPISLTRAGVPLKSSAPRADLVGSELSRAAGKAKFSVPPLTPSPIGSAKPKWGSSVAPKVELRSLLSSLAFPISPPDNIKDKRELASGQGRDQSSLGVPNSSLRSSSDELKPLSESLCTPARIESDRNRNKASLEASEKVAREKTPAGSVLLAGSEESCLSADNRETTSRNSAPVSQVIEGRKASRDVLCEKTKTHLPPGERIAITEKNRARSKATSGENGLQSAPSNLQTNEPVENRIKSPSLRSPPLDDHNPRNAIGFEEPCGKPRGQSPPAGHIHEPLHVLDLVRPSLKANDIAGKIRDCDDQIVAVDRKLFELQSALRMQSTGLVKSANPADRRHPQRMRQQEEDGFGRAVGSLARDERDRRETTVHKFQEGLRLVLTRNRCLAAAASAELRPMCSNPEVGLQMEVRSENAFNSCVSEEVKDRVTEVLRKRQSAAIDRKKELRTEYDELHIAWRRRLKSSRDKKSKEKREAIRERDRYLLISTKGQSALLTSRTSSGRMSTKIFPSLSMSGQVNSTAEIDAVLSEIAAEGGTPGAKDIWSKTLAEIPDQNIEYGPPDSKSVYVEDPVKDLHHSRAINPWSFTEKLTFLEKYAIYPKNFRKIAKFLELKSTRECSQFYYSNKLDLGLKQLAKEASTLKRKGLLKMQIVRIAKKRLWIETEEEIEAAVQSFLTNHSSGGGHVHEKSAQNAAIDSTSDGNQVVTHTRKLHPSLLMVSKKQLLLESANLDVEDISPSLFLRAYSIYGPSWREISAFMNLRGKTSSHFRDFYMRNWRTLPLDEKSRDEVERTDVSRSPTPSLRASPRLSPRESSKFSLRACVYPSPKRSPRLTITSQNCTEGQSVHYPDSELEALMLDQDVSPRTLKNEVKNEQKTDVDDQDSRAVNISRIVGLGDNCVSPGIDDFQTKLEIDSRKHKTSSWTGAECEKFKELFKTCGRDWKRIAHIMSPKTAMQVKGYWLTVADEVGNGRQPEPTRATQNDKKKFWRSPANDGLIREPGTVDKESGMGISKQSLSTCSPRIGIEHSEGTHAETDAKGLTSEARKDEAIASHDAERRIRSMTTSAVIARSLSYDYGKVESLRRNEDSGAPRKGLVRAASVGDNVKQFDHNRRELSRSPVLRSVPAQIPRSKPMPRTVPQVRSSPVRDTNDIQHPAGPKSLASNNGKNYGNSNQDAGGPAGLLHSFAKRVSDAGEDDKHNSRN